MDVYLEKEEYDMNYQTKHKPCDFLQEDGNCKLGDCKPDSCKKYPYTDQPERLSSLLSVLDTIEICLVAFEIFERLKEEYRFKKIQISPKFSLWAGSQLYLSRRRRYGGSIWL